MVLFIVSQLSWALQSDSPAISMRVEGPLLAHQCSKWQRRYRVSTPGRSQENGVRCTCLSLLPPPPGSWSLTNNLTSISFCTVSNHTCLKMYQTDNHFPDTICSAHDPCSFWPQGTYSWLKAHELIRNNAILVENANREERRLWWWLKLEGDGQTGLEWLPSSNWKAEEASETKRGTVNRQEAEWEQQPTSSATEDRNLHP